MKRHPTTFTGQSGTGKTLAAEVLARHFHLTPYRIDLDPAKPVPSRRGRHERYANLETGYLLLTLEVFEGVIILASNPRNHVASRPHLADLLVAEDGLRWEVPGVPPLQ